MLSSDMSDKNRPDTRSVRINEHEIDDKKNSVPFTAPIIAHYRAMETKCENRLIVDPFAERLAGDMIG